MIEVLFIIAKTISMILGIVSIAMMIRALLPIFTDVSDNRLFLLACTISEPFVAPVRAIMVKLNIGQSSPIDWSFSIAYMIIILLRLFLPVI